ncbi:DUF1800 domain-containing protein [Novosphingobium sp. KCTC 2891]|uniref:DUF1800 domain-containing protein n=1 Tax=Novosphingobium sp. KCTC 2891 TaxID=2989730 RepID=UPI002222349B|nr:DUF1800 domain-containing protein [Novosphingobium sp. KCTC 2891]MCW1381473.1 DUF1800 domain-containing protein [Novosphingobium sp. KCTC 2891]
MDKAFTTLIRFGLGRRPGEALPADPARWGEAQFAAFRPALPGADRLARPEAVLARYLEYLKERKAEKQAQARSIAMAEAGAGPGTEPGMDPGIGPANGPVEPLPAAKPAEAAGLELRRFLRQQYTAQVGLRLRAAASSDAPFVERLVHFWANHFAVSADRADLRALTAFLEFDAIRPHVLGRFEDMLVAVERHPAMLLYLDQAKSVGPGSALGRRSADKGRPIGLNENLGREILELHTLGVRAGYSQADVTELARALTGWSVTGLGRGVTAGAGQGTAPAGQFVYAADLHEPGSRTVLGKTYSDGGEGQARAVLADLARAPATARHIAVKLARHFVADDPPPALVAGLEQAFLESGGDLPRVYAALLSAPEALAGAPAKFRSPWQWTLASLRGAPELLRGMTDQGLTATLEQLGQPTWRPGSPAGFDDIAAAWAAPDALYRRIEAAGRLAAQYTQGDPRALAQDLFGAGLSPATRDTVARADSAQQGFALLLVSPEMLRC